LVHPASLGGSLLCDLLFSTADHHALYQPLWGHTHVLWLLLQDTCQSSPWRSQLPQHLSCLQQGQPNYSNHHGQLLTLSSDQSMVWLPILCCHTFHFCGTC
jgi:hypothetical protein